MRKLNKKKGFTLIEVIVVIAIIGVLAAILIPTMLGYVVRSRVNNANAAADKMRDHISYFLTQANADGYGMVLSNTSICDCEITILNGKWKVKTSDPKVFVSYYTVKWSGSGSGEVDDKNATSDNAEDRLAIYLANLFRDVEDGYVSFRLVGGVCTALYFTSEQTTAVTEMPDFGASGGWDIQSFTWNDSNQGITDSGIVVGTSPMIP